MQIISNNGFKKLFKSTEACSEANFTGIEPSLVDIFVLSLTIHNLLLPVKFSKSFLIQGIKKT